MKHLAHIDKVIQLNVVFQFFIILFGQNKIKLVLKIEGITSDRIGSYFMVSLSFRFIIYVREYYTKNQNQRLNKFIISFHVLNGCDLDQNT